MDAARFLDARGDEKQVINLERPKYKNECYTFSQIRVTRLGMMMMKDRMIGKIAAKLLNELKCVFSVFSLAGFD